MQDMLAKSYYNIASMYFEQGKPQLALEALKAAERLRTLLVNLHPSVTSYRADLGTVHMKTADAERQLKHPTEALARANKALSRSSECLSHYSDFNQ
jgi:tetratricopeptide (TPR) repeat protein